MTTDDGEHQDALTAEQLKARAREERDSSPQAVNLRVHRAISWLSRAEQEANDPDAEVIFYWVAFNAAYGRVQDADDMDGGSRSPSERGLFHDFFDLILELDTEKRVYKEIWERFSGPIRILLNNQYVFQPFWDNRRGKSGAENWESWFKNSQRNSMEALAQQDTLTVLAIVFDRLYVLRNQLVHGGATWKSSVNRRQVVDGARILSFLVPLFVSIMMDNMEEDWGEPAYPPVDGID